MVRFPDRSSGLACPCRPRRSLASLRSFLALFALTLLAFAAGPLGAQVGCHTIIPPCNYPPAVTVAPGSQTVTSADVPITITVSDDSALSPSSVSTSPSMTLTASWGPGNATGTLTGTLHLTTTTTLSVTVCDASSDDLCTTTSATYTYAPPPSPPAQDSASLWLPSYSSVTRTLAGCSGCLYGGASYTTPAYVSRDTPRGVSLLYSSAEAAPRGLVQIDATVNTSTVPDKISLQLMQGATSATLTNGGTAAWYAGDTGVVRLAAQLDASSLATGVYDYTAVVSTWWGATVYQSRQAIRVLILNTQSSPVGAGWTIAGLQQIVSAGGDSVAIADGSGRLTFFARSGATTFAPTDGDATTLTVTSGVYTRKAIDGSFARFSAAGLLTAVGTRFGDSTVYSYDGSNRLTGITDEAGKTTTLTYAPNGACPGGSTSGTLCAITTPGGRVSTMVVNGSNDLVQVIDPDGVTALTGTYSSHLLTALTDRLASTTALAYDSFTGLASITAPAVTTTTTGGSTTSESPTVTLRSIEATLLATGNSTSGTARAVVHADTAYAVLTAPNGTVTALLLQGAGEPTRIVTRPVTGPSDTTRIGYQSNRWPISIARSPVGGQWVGSWSGDQPLVSVDPTGTRTEYHYGPYGQADTVLVNGVVQQVNHYTGADSTLATSTVAGAQTSYTWDSHGRLTSVTDPGGHVTSLAYEAGGFQNDSTQSLAVARVTHDAYGRDSVVIDLAGQSTTTVYDLLNRPTTLTQPGSVATTTSYTESTGAHTVTTAVTDPRSLTVSGVANALGWATQTTDAQSATATAGYDRNGALRRAVDRASGVVIADYDSLGRLTRRVAGADSAAFLYDAGSHATDAHWQVAVAAASRDSVAFDGIGRPALIASTGSGGATTTLVPTFNAGLRSYLTVTGTAGGGWTRTLQFGRTATFDPSALPEFGRAGWNVLALAADGTVDTLTLQTNGSPLRLRPHDYTSAHRPQQVDLLVGGTVVDHWTYSYDALDRLIFADSGSSTNHVLRAFTYDALGRLASYSDTHIYADSTQESCPDNQIICDPPPPWDYTWHDDVLRSATYSPDHSGNRTDGSASLTHDRLTSMTGADGRNYSFTYDAEGRRLTKTASGYSQTYGWNALGQLTWVTTNGDSVAFAYDAAGRRVRKDHAGTTTRYVWDGDQLLLQLDGSGAPQWEFSEGLGVDAPIAVRRSSDGKRFYYQYDGAGNVVALWDTTNTRVATYTDDPYGDPIASTGSVAQPLRWKGRELDSETGLYYLRARYYDPTVGRFLSEDPAGLAGGINPVTFADGEPVNRSDPSGMVCIVTVTEIDDVRSLDGVDISRTKIGELTTKSADCYGSVNGTGGSGSGNPVPRRACPVVPMAPPGVSVNSNMKKARNNAIWNPLWILWFKNEVQYGGPWDYKTQGAQYEDFGNFNYGAAGTAAFAPAFTLLRAAGWAQRNHPSSPQFPGDPGSLTSIFLNPFGGTPPYGDDPHDQQMIQRGIQYARNGCGR